MVLISISGFPAQFFESLSEFGARMSWLADRMILEGSRQTGEGNQIFSFEELQELCDLPLSANPALAELLADMVVERPEVRLANIRGDCLALSFYPEYC